MTSTDQEQAVLDYYSREARGYAETTPLAGLRLEVFRLARARLVERGVLVRTCEGRYVPVEAVRA